MVLIFALTALFLALLSLGLWSGRRVHSFEDYLVAGRSLPFSVAVPTIVATWVGAGTCLGVSGEVYSDGFSAVIADPFAIVGGLFVAALFFVGPFRGRNLLTSTDIIEQQYGRSAGVFAAVITLPLYIGTLAAQLVAIGFVANLLIGVHPQVGMILGSIAIAFYTSIGGMWAVSITDCLQFVLLVLGVGILLPCSVAQVDSGLLWTQVQSEASTMFSPSLQQGGLLSYTGQWLLTGLGAIMGQDLIQRALSCRSPKEARSSTFAAGICYLGFAVVPLLIGLAGRTLLPNLENPSMLIPMLAQQYLSPAFFALFVVGLLSAVMSTGDSYLLAAMSILVRNVVMPLKPLSNAQALQAMRWGGVILTFFALIAGQMMPHIFALMVHSTATLFVCLFVPVTAALYFPHTPKSAGWAGLLGGLFGWLAYLYIYRSQLTVATDATLFAAAIIGFATSLTSLVIACVVNKFSQPISATA